MIEFSMTVFCLIFLGSLIGYGSWEWANRSYISALESYYKNTKDQVLMLINEGDSHD